MAKKPTKSTKTATSVRKSPRTQKPQGGWFSRLFKFCFKWGLVLGLWLSIILAAVLFWYSAELPNITKSMVFERRPTIIIQASNGDIVDRYGDLKGKIVDVTKLPPHIKNAVLATEDRRFYKHFGMDLKGFVRALYINVKQGGFVQGGSTITQQLAKNLFLTRDRTIKRKIQELMLAFQLEKELTKDEILSAYLNRVYLGNGAYGIDAAANAYFNKSAEELNIREAATIAGLLKAPSRYSPSSSPERAAARTSVVLQSMIEAGYATEEEIAGYKNTPPAPRRKPSSGESVRYYTDYIISQLGDLIGNVEEDIIIETTMDKTIQNEMEQSITKAILNYGPKNNVEQGAAVTMRLDGAVVALMGGRDYSMSEFNRVTDSLRPPGSSFKPIVYLAAIENGWNLNDYITDEPKNYGSYKPRNFGNKYYGDITIFEALTLSLNTVAVQLMKDVGPANVIALAQRLGITAKLEPDLSTSLGSSGVPMIQMATAYATIGRGGTVVDPYSITKIKTVSGEVLYERTEPKEAERIVAEKDILQVTAMMQSVIANGTGRGASIPFPAAGKTGTSQNFRDAWFVGFSTKYATAVWFGNDDNSETKRLTGGSAPAQVWRDVMNVAQRQSAKSYGLFSNISYDKEDEFGFQRMLSSISGKHSNNSAIGVDGDWLKQFFGNETLDARMKAQRRNMNREEPASEYTPLGRHQWDVNE